MKTRTTYIQCKGKDGLGLCTEEIKTVFPSDINNRASEILETEHETKVQKNIQELKDEGYIDVHVAVQHICPQCHGAGVIYIRE